MGIAERIAISSVMVLCLQKGTVGLAGGWKLFVSLSEVVIDIDRYVINHQLVTQVRNMLYIYTDIEDRDMLQIINL